MHELTNEVGKSKYIKTNKITASFNLQQFSMYIIVPMLEFANTMGQFAFTITAPPGSVYCFYELPPFNAVTVTGQWTEGRAGGYLSLNNPQFELFISRGGKFSIILERIDGGNITGMIFMVMKGLSIY